MKTLPFPQSFLLGFFLLANASFAADTSAPSESQREHRPETSRHRNFSMRRAPLFRALDTDRDGVLSPAELDGAAGALKRLDRNGDGKVEARELGGMSAEDGPAGPGQELGRRKCPEPGARSFRHRPRGRGFHGPMPGPHGEGRGFHGPIPGPHGEGRGFYGPMPGPHGEGRGFHGPMPGPHGEGRGFHGPMPGPHGEGRGFHGPMPGPHGEGRGFHGPDPERQRARE